MKKTFFIGCIALLFAITLMPGAQAVGILPFIVEDVSLEPGETVTRQVTVFNGGDEEQIYYLLARNFTTKGEEGEAVVSEEEFGLATWIDFPFESVSIPAKDSQDVEYSIIVPPNADAGGHFAAVFASTSPPDVDRGVGLSGNVGSLVFVTVEGDIIEDLRIIDFYVKGDTTVFNRLPVEFEYRIENRGTVHERPEGTITMDGWFGKTEINANPNENRILPSSIRRIDTFWVKDMQSIETGGFFTELKNEWKNFAFGKYSAELELDYGYSTDNITAQVDFWVFPWRVCLVGLLILIAAIVGIILYNKLVVATARKKGSV